MPRTPIFHLRYAASLASLLLLSLISLFPGCGSSNQAPVAETKKFRPADDSGAAPATGQFPIDGADYAAPTGTAKTPRRNRRPLPPAAPLLPALKPFKFPAI